jgi:hypothetical protein
VEEVARNPSPSALGFNLKNLFSWPERDFVNLDSLPCGRYEQAEPVLVLLVSKPRKRLSLTGSAQICGNGSPGCLPAGQLQRAPGTCRTSAGYEVRRCRRRVAPRVGEVARSSKSASCCGGAAFFALNLCERLLERGTDLVRVDNFFAGGKRNISHNVCGDMYTTYGEHGSGRITGDCIVIHLLSV